MRKTVVFALTGIASAVVLIGISPFYKALAKENVPGTTQPVSVHSSSDYKVAKLDLVKKPKTQLRIYPEFRGQTHLAALDNKNSLSGSKTSAPSPGKVRALVRNTLIALNQANLTGNYTVFRSLASPRFRDRYSVDRLIEVFRTMRETGIDLDFLVAVKLKFAHPPRVITHGLLRTTGYFQTKPNQLGFTLVYEKDQKKWKLYGIKLHAADTQTEVSQK